MTATIYGSILAAIRRAPNSQTVSDLAQTLSLSPDEVTQAITILHRKEFIAKNRASAPGANAYYVRRSFRALLDFLLVTENLGENLGGMDLRDYWNSTDDRSSHDHDNDDDDFGEDSLPEPTQTLTPTVDDVNPDEGQ